MAPREICLWTTWTTLRIAACACSLSGKFVACKPLWIRHGRASDYRKDFSRHFRRLGLENLGQGPQRAGCLSVAFLCLAVGLALASPRVPTELFQHWVHSHEEDTKSMLVYRPASYSFPLSRGRDGFEIRSDGGFVLFFMGPTDRVERAVGHWESIGNQTIRVRFEDEKIKSRVMRISSVSKDILRVERQSNSGSGSPSILEY